jgi:hypothetical protein
VKYLNENTTYKDHLVILTFMMYFILSPFYLWQSGTPQIADFVLILSIFTFMMSNKQFVGIKKHKKMLIIIMFFSLWVVTVNMTWSIFLQNHFRFLTTSMFYLYNSLVLVFTIVLVHKFQDILIKKIFYAVFASLFVQFGLFMLNGNFNQIGRISGMFNNPNQLGYFGLLSFAILLFINRRIKVSILYMVLSMIFSFVLVLSSLSNGAILSWVVLFISFMILELKNFSMKYRFIFLCFLLSITLMSFYLLSNEGLINQRFVTKFFITLSETNEKIEYSFYQRGYYRILEHPEFLLFGSGEGVYERFTLRREFHSTLGNIQLSYGIVGFILFLLILIKSLKSDKFRSWYLIFAILMYGYSHNGIRNTFFWILLALIYYQPYYQTSNVKTLKE